MKTLGCLAFLLIFSVFFPQNANGYEQFFDDFSGTVLSGWTLVRNEVWGNPSLPCMNGTVPAQWSVGNGVVTMEISGTPCVTEIVPNITEAETAQNYRFEFDMTMHESMNMDRNYLLKRKDGDNWYGVKIIGDTLFLEKVVGGAGYSVSGGWATYPFLAGETYHILNEVVEHSIRISINGEQVLSFEDEEPFLENAQVGLRASAGTLRHSVVSFDNVRFETLPDEVTLNIPYYSQLNLHWRDFEYDHAAFWSPGDQTIGAWGCALTSAVMLLRYHGITVLPDGFGITPRTLNTWLTTQPDGYIGNGYVNWHAITRISAVSRDLYGTPALEVSYTKLRDDVIYALQQHSPSILQVPGHYVVAGGFSQSREHIYIMDPIDNLNHTLETYGETFASARLFIPSHTDLSYILIAHDSSVMVTLSDGTAASETITETPFTGSSQKPLSITYLKQPGSGSYSLKVSGNFQGEQKLDIYAYDANGNVHTYQTPAFSGQTFTLDYDESGNITVESVLDPMFYPEGYGQCI